MASPGVGSIMVQRRFRKTVGIAEGCARGKAVARPLREGRLVACDAFPVPWSFSLNSSGTAGDYQDEGASRRHVD